MKRLVVEDLIRAPMFAIFWASSECVFDVQDNGLRTGQFIESDDGGPHDEGVMEQLKVRKVSIGLHVEIDDERAKGFDDLDAALAHLRYSEKPIIKVPDKLTSLLYKFYVVERMGW